MRIDIKQLKFLHWRLRQVLTWLESSTGLDFLITSQYRIDDPGVHGTMPLRAHDLRIRSELIGRAIAKHINAGWMYDADRPGLQVAKAHGQGSNFHIHIQVHPKTKRRR